MGSPNQQDGDENESIAVPSSHPPDGVVAALAADGCGAAMMAEAVSPTGARGRSVGRAGSGTDFGEVLAEAGQEVIRRLLRTRPDVGDLVSSRIFPSRPESDSGGKGTVKEMGHRQRTDCGTWANCGPTRPGRSGMVRRITDIPAKGVVTVVKPVAARVVVLFNVRRCSAHSSWRSLGAWQDRPMLLARVSSLIPHPRRAQR